MNLLFDFLKTVLYQDKNKLAALKPGGKSGQVWQMLNQQALQKHFDRELIETSLKISSSHFDKITSQLLAKCYEHLFGNDKAQLLSYLSQQGPLLKHFYQELKRQSNFAEKNFSPAQRALFYKNAVDLIHFNMPIMHKDEEVLRALANKYLSIEKNRNARLLIECRLMYVHIDKLFAAALVHAQATEVRKQIDALGALPDDADEELAFAWWWLNIYFYHATENFGQAAKVAKQAIAALSTYQSALNSYNILRIKLKLAELLYYNSRFEESFKGFQKLLKANEPDNIPDSRFYIAKYLQVCLITDNLNEAKDTLDNYFKKPVSYLKEILLPRDIISFAKYYLFTGDYDEAFEFIQLGFARNPKGQYFQYEVELRNLQTAYFFLTRQKKLALQMCNKHIKYLRSHNYGIRQSDFPYFFVLTKAIYDKTERDKNLTVREEQMLQRYQQGSYAVYGKLLLKMLHA